MTRLSYIIIFLCTATLMGCTPKKKKTIPYYDYSSSYEEASSSIDIPFSVEGGVKWVTAKIDGVSTDMIFDTGCSGVLISPLEVAQLIKRGVVTEADCIDTVKTLIADGSVMEMPVYLIKTLELSNGTKNIVCSNVQTAVSSSIDGPVLLGNDVFDRVASFVVDNENQLIKFTLK